MTNEEIRKVSVGDHVGFKCDIEQSGKVTRIKKDGYGYTVFELENTDGFQGGYIGGNTTHEERAEDCWI